MGAKADETLELKYEDLPAYLHMNHSAYMAVEGDLYYLTDVNERYWRVQDTTQLNDKGHYIDCSPLVPTISEFLKLPFRGGKCIKDLFEQTVFYASV